MKNLDTRRATLIGLVLVGVTLCCCLLTISGWAMGGFRALFQAQANEIAETQVGLAVNAPVILDIAHTAGTITVQGDGEDEIVVEVTARGRTLAEAQAVRALLTNEDDTILLRLEGAQAEGLLVDLLIHTPPDTALLIEGKLGNIQVEDLQGALDISTDLGSVTIRHHAADEHLRVESNNGNIDLSGESIEADTIIDLSTRVGTISVDLPDGIGFQLEASTPAGEIQVGGYTLTEQTEAKQGASHSLTALVEPADGRTLTLKSSAGDILLRGR